MNSRGARIKQALEARAVRKQHALARALGVHESAITRWKEDGTMTLDNAIALCRELDISADWLLLGIGHMDQHKERSEVAPAHTELLALLSPGAAAALMKFIRLVAAGQS
ncbi:MULTISPECIES: helix-turn-helix transcriptional regulator [unclassified Bradyrhizobium]|uniref:helix-turn-helix domain-containing protein n=1 Tax=unclassified Bradyrhizobium TaxID=2631580 RepID=UPI0028EA2567|nr:MULTISPECIES: helix-turn-helix transcriptional regulator [unclassified Bradyrhizobium]